MIETIEQLTQLETTRLTECEARVERGLSTFVDVGSALLEIRDSRLYRAEYRTFEEYCRKRWGMSRSRAHRMIEAAEVYDNLLPIGNKPETESQARPLAALPPEQQPTAWQRAQEISEAKGNGKVTASIVQTAVDEIAQKRPHVSHNSGNNEWYTPPEYIEAARAVMGTIDLDPASSDEANTVVGAPLYYTIETDGLDKQWHGNVWLNPPYAGDWIEKFAGKIIFECSSGRVDQAIVLVNNATETVWFQSMTRMAKAICFPQSRVKFWGPGGKTGAPLQGQALIYFGPSPEKFNKVFSQFGLVLWIATTAGA